MPRLSKGPILHGIRTYNGTEEAELHIFGSQGKQKGGSVTSLLNLTTMAERKSGTSVLAVMAERKCESRISHFWQLKQSVS